ncbi:hypothetical protein Tco_0778726, partial [Tanacetum coccineum]
MNNQKVEVQSRNVQSSLNMKNRASKSVCSICNECLFSKNHDMSVVDYLNDVNARARYKSIKSIKRKNGNLLNLGLLTTRNPTEFGDPTFQTLQSLLVSNADNTSGPALHHMTSKYFLLELGFKEKKGLVQNLSSSTPSVLPSKKDLDILFQPLFDEYFNPPSSVVSLVLPAAAPLPADTTDTPSSTTIDQDEPSVST